VGPNDGVRAMRAWGVLLARQDDEAAQFEQKQERMHPRGQVIGVRRGVRPLLHGALVLAATVATAMRAMMTAAAAVTATREFASQRRSDI